MKLLVVDTFYAPYIENLYRFGLEKTNYQEQHRAHFRDGFGTGDAYSTGLASLGVEAIELVANSERLQDAWAREYQPQLLHLPAGGQRLLAILQAQVGAFSPDVLYVQDINWLPAGFLRQLKDSVPMLVGQNACPLAPGLDLAPYDLLLTSLPHYVERFRCQGVAAAYFPIGFDQRLLLRYPTAAPRQYPLTFVGGLGGYHSRGTQQLEIIAQELPLQVWGYGGQQLPETSILRSRWQGEAWAGAMYSLLAQSQITINRHIDIAEGYANNMRLYEATGMGACLVTDAKANLASLFEPDREVVTYRSPEEAISKLRVLLEHPEEAAAIALRGQERTLRQHSYGQRMQLLVELLRRHWPATNNQPMPVFSQLPAQRSILVVCDQTNLLRLPGRLRKPGCTLLTDANGLQNTDLGGLPRWVMASEVALESLCTSCFDAVSPQLVVLFKGDDTASSLLITAEKIAKNRGLSLVCFP